MSTILWVEGWEHGIVSTAGTGILNGITGAATIDSTIKNSGSYSINFTGAPASNYASRSIAGTATTVLTCRFYLYFTTLPSGDTPIWFSVAAAGNIPRMDFIQSTAKLRVNFAGSGAKDSASTFTTGQWYRIDYKANVSANPRTIDWYVDGVAQTQATNATAASYFTGIYFGPYTSCTSNMNFDDIFMRDDTSTAGSWPISSSDTLAEGLFPSGAGTSNLDTTIEDNGGTDVNDATNPANIELDEVPLGSGTDYILQKTQAGAALYAEVVFADTTLGTILGASAYEAYRSAAATGSNSASAKIHDEDAVDTAIYTGDMTETSTFYKSVILPTPAGGWDAAAVNALTGRVGYATDITTVPYFYGIMVQAYGVASAGGTNIVQMII